MAFPNEKNIKSGFESGFGFSLPLMRKIFLGLNFGHWKSSVHKEVGKLYEGKLSVTPFFFSLQFKPMEKNTINPYVLFGVSIVFARFEIGEYISIPEVTISQKIRNGLGLHIEGGSDLHLTENLAFFAAMNYLFWKTKAETTISDMNFGLSTEEFSIRLDSLILKVGMKYFF